MWPIFGGLFQQTEIFFHLFSASVLKGVLKSGKNDNMAVDENRRDTYNHSLPSGNWPSVFGDFDGDLKQLITVRRVIPHSLLFFNVEYVLDYSNSHLLFWRRSVE